MYPIEALTIQPGMLVQQRYLVTKQLGKGGFGATFEVDDGGKAKVLKVLLTNYPKAVSLFQREAEVLCQLRHPGIPRVEPGNYFTFSYQTNDLLHCLVMEKIDGLNLQEWLNKNQPIAPEQAANWLEQLAEILDKIHQQQYFHRDIKPVNIMLKPDGQLVLIDFGAVREVTETYLEKLDGKQITGINSPGYTPPEQSDGSAVLQSDFFALGRTFVHLLTGKHPLKFSRNLQTGELIWKADAPQITECFGQLIDDLMATFPAQRPQNSQVVLQRLRGEQFYYVIGIKQQGEQGTEVQRLNPVADALLSSYGPNNNLGNRKQLSAGAWTNSGTRSYIRSLIKFDIQPPPKNYQLLVAKLSLFADTTVPLYGQGQFNSEPIGHSQLSGSNEWLLLPVTSSWSEDTVTWATKPETMSASQLMQASRSSSQNYEDIDITDLVRLCLNEKINHGFLMKLKIEVPYREVTFHSRKTERPDLQPKLEIYYIK